MYSYQHARPSTALFTCISGHCDSAAARPLHRSMNFITSLLSGGDGKAAPGFLESVVASVLQKVLGAFVRGLDKENLELSIWDGDVRLQGLELRTEVLDALPLPVRVIGGSLGEVRVCVPWRNLLGGEPLVITVDGVLLLLAPRGEEEPEDSAEAEAKRALAEAAEGVEEQQEAQDQMGPGLVDRLVQCAPPAQSRVLSPSPMSRCLSVARQATQRRAARCPLGVRPFRAWRPGRPAGLAPALVPTLCGRLASSRARLTRFGARLVPRRSVLQKLQVSVTNVHARVVGGPEADAVVGGAYIREVVVDELPEEQMLSRSRDGDRGAEAEHRLLQMLSRKRVRVGGLALYMDTTAGPHSRMRPVGAPSSSDGGGGGAAAAAARAAARAQAAESAVEAAVSSTVPERDAGAPPALVAPPGWEEEMRRMIHAPPGPGHILAPSDLTVGAVFDLGARDRPPSRPPAVPWL